MKKKKLKLQYLRIASQIFFFIFFPGLFALAFTQIGEVISMIVHGNVNGDMLIVNLLLGVILIGLGVLFGRFFCGWMCSFGAMNDLLYYISKKLFKVRFKISESLDKKLKLLKYLVLILIAVIFWVGALSIKENLDPWRSFAEIAKLPPKIPVLSVGLVFLILIIIGSMLIERFFCRYLCPLGAIFSIFGKFKIVNIYKEKSPCGKCTACTAKCSMGLSLYKEDKVVEMDCINCFKCVDVCPKENVELGIAKKSINSAVIIIIFIIVFFILYVIKGVIANKILKNYIPSNNNEVSNISKETKTIIDRPMGNLYEDGTYLGSGKGYNSNIEVKLTIAKGKISKVNVVSIGDTPSYYESAVKIIPSEIIESQSINVDVVAGATQSSMGIIDATKNALLKAIGGKSEENSAMNSESLRDYTKGEINSGQAVTLNFPGKEEIATIGNSTVKVNVSLSGQMIEAVKVERFTSNEKNAKEALKNIPQEILSAQGTNVQLVPGAENISKAIIKAVNKAIEN